MSRAISAVYAQHGTGHTFLQSCAQRRCTASAQLRVPASVTFGRNTAGSSLKSVGTNASKSLRAFCHTLSTTHTGIATMPLEAHHQQKHYKKCTVKISECRPYIHLMQFIMITSRLAGSGSQHIPVALHVVFAVPHALMLNMRMR